MSISSVSYGTTPNGNQYKKTKAGTKTGLATGLGYAGFGAAVLTKTKTGKLLLIENIKKTKDKLMALGYDKVKALKTSKACSKIGVALGLAVAVAAFTGVGALVDKCINKSRAKKADKEAQEA